SDVCSSDLPLGDTTVEVNSTTQLIIVKRIFGRVNAKLRLRNTSLAPREFSQAPAPLLREGSVPHGPVGRMSFWSHGNLLKTGEEAFSGSSKLEARRQRSG